MATTIQKRLYSLNSPKVIEKLSILEASIDAICIKVKGFSKNLRTPSFYEYHTFFNEMVDKLKHLSYKTGERLRSMGAPANHSVWVLEQKTIVKDSKKRQTDPAWMVLELLENYVDVALLVRDIFILAGEAKDPATVGFSTVAAELSEHYAWELFVMAGGDD